jgi:hypothetical protein
LVIDYAGGGGGINGLIGHCPYLQPRLIIKPLPQHPSQHQNYQGKDQERGKAAVMLLT